MSPLESNPRPRGPYRRPRADIYTVLLLLTLFALLIGILCLYFEMDAYNFEFKGGPTVSAERSTMVAIVVVRSANQRFVRGANNDCPLTPNRMSTDAPSTV